MENFFDKFDSLENTPTSLMKDVTETPKENKSDLSSLTDHTTATEPTMTNPGNSQPNNSTPGFNMNNNQPQQMNAGKLITGDMATGFLDMLVPVVIVLIVDKIAGKKINKRYLQATADEKKTLSPVLQNWLNSINFNVDNPFNALLLTCAFIYGTKTIEVMNMEAPPPPVRMPSPFIDNRPAQQQQRQQRPAQNNGRNLDGTPKKDGRGRPRKNS